MTTIPRDFITLDRRDLTTIRTLAPRYRRLSGWRKLLFGQSARITCGYCARPGRRRVLIVNPLTLRREHHRVCGDRCSTRLRDWQDVSDARRRRAQFDWEMEHPTLAAATLVEELPAQYPSITRSTLRTFIDSGYDAAAIANSKAGRISAASLNGTIERLGFSNSVYAEIRSGQTVIRRTKDA